MSIKLRTKDDVILTIASRKIIAGWWKQNEKHWEHKPYAMCLEDEHGNYFHVEYSLWMSIKHLIGIGAPGRSNAMFTVHLTVVN